MPDQLHLTPAWIAAAAQLPIVGVLVTLIYRNRAAAGRAMAKLSEDHGEHLAALMEARLEIAKGYATKDYVGAVEVRLTAHLTRLETKLDQHLTRDPKNG